MTFGLWAAAIAAAFIWGAVAAYAQPTPSGLPGATPSDPQAAVAKAAINIEGGWTRATPGASANAAVYLRIVNTGKESDTLVGAESNMAQKTELHDSAMNGGMMQMTMTPSIEIAPMAQLVFQPGGRHVMLTGLKAPLKEGDSFILTLNFKKAGKLSVTIKVLAVNAVGPEKQSGMAMPFGNTMGSMAGNLKGLGAGP